MHREPSKVRTILIVDDFEDMRSTMRIWLERLGYRVIEAADGDMAVVVARLEHPSLILMDIGMPLRSGISATYMIHSDPELSEIPIVAITAYDGDEVHEDALKSGCVACLTKPVDLDELERLLSGLIE